MKTSNNNDSKIESPNKPFAFSSFLPNFRSTVLSESKFAPNQNINTYSPNPNFLPLNKSKVFLKDPEIDEFSKLKAELDFLKQESANERTRLSHELNLLAEKNLDWEKKHMLLISDLDRQSLLLNEKNHELDYWRNKCAVVEASISKQSSEQEKLARNNSDINQIMEKWKEKYSEFEKVYLEQQNQFETLKIKHKRLEKKYDQLIKEQNELKETRNREITVLNELQMENDKLRRNIMDIEEKQQKYIEEIEGIRAEFSDYREDHDRALEETRKEGSKMIQEIQGTYQEVLHKKLQTENQSKQMMEQIKEMMIKIQKQEEIITEKENKILEIGVKLNETENQVSQLNFQLSQKDQSLFKMKSEVAGVVNNSNQTLKPQEGVGVRLLEAKVEKQQAEIISLKKSLEFNEKYKSNEKMIEYIKNKEKECEILKEKLKEQQKPNINSDFLLDELKTKIFLLSVENERLHTVLNKKKIDDNNEKLQGKFISNVEINEPDYLFKTNYNDNEKNQRIYKNNVEIYHPDYHSNKGNYHNNEKLQRKLLNDLDINDPVYPHVERNQSKDRIQPSFIQNKFENDVFTHKNYKSENNYNSWNNQNINNFDNNTEFGPRNSTRTKIIHDNKNQFYSPTYRDQNNFAEFYSPTYRGGSIKSQNMNNNGGKNSILIKDYEESVKELEDLKGKLRDSMNKKEQFYSRMNYNNYPF